MPSRSVNKSNILVTYASREKSFWDVAAGLRGFLVVAADFSMLPVKWVAVTGVSGKSGEKWWRRSWWPDWPVWKYNLDSMLTD